MNYQQLLIIFQRNQYHLWEEESQGELKEIYRDGKLLVDELLINIRS